MAEGTYEWNEEYGYSSWDTRNTQKQKGFEQFGYSPSLGSRSLFTYQDEKFYLVEAMRKNKRTNTHEQVIVMCDKYLVPLIELPMQLPYPYSKFKNFTAPTIRE